MTTITQVKPQPWSEAQKTDWADVVESAGKTRFYEKVIDRLDRLSTATHEMRPYGVNAPGYAGFYVMAGDVHNGNPNVLITAGVHGYEPSGVEAALQFLETDAHKLTDRFNFVVYPCISPWAYEYDQRWNRQAEDVNRNFSKAAGIVQIPECTVFMSSIDRRSYNIACAIDLHETSDRDIVLRQMRALRFGTELDRDYRKIPQGYYVTLSLMGTGQENQCQLAFGKSIVDRVKPISPIAPEPRVMGQDNRGGVILSPASDGLLRSFLQARAPLVAVTEVYPDHPQMTPQKAVAAQRASIRGALDFILR